MKIAICGSGKVFSEEIAKKSFEIGKLLSQKGYKILTGGCNGYPHNAAKGSGNAIGYSPAKDIDEHINKYGFPTDELYSFVFTGKGIPDRNLDLIRAADAVVILDGKVGTLNEFTLAFNLKKKIFVLDSTKLSSVIKSAVEVIDKDGEKENVAYFRDEKGLVGKLI